MFLNERLDGRRVIAPLVRFCLGFAVIVVTTPADASPGKDECIASNEAGQDARRAGKLRDAVERFDSCAATSCPAPIREDCVRRGDEARRAMPTIVVRASDTGGNAIGDVRVVVDGVSVAPDSGGVGVSVDPGEHRVDVSADGFSPLSKTVVVREGVKGRVERVTLERSTPARPERADVSGAHSATNADGEGQRRWAMIAGGIGLAATAFGVVAGIVALGKKDLRDSACGGTGAYPDGCDPAKRVDVLDAQSDVKTWGNLSTIGIASGGVLLLAGGFFYLTAPTRSTLAMKTAPGFAAIALSQPW